MKIDLKEITVRDLVEDDGGGTATAGRSSK